MSADLVIAATNPGFGFTNPLPPGADQHIAAVAMFGNGTRRILGPVPDFSPAFADKTIDQCAPGDPICSNGTTLAVALAALVPRLRPGRQAATFVAGRL